MDDLLELMRVPSMPEGKCAVARRLMLQESAFEELVSAKRLPALISALAAAIEDDPVASRSRIPQLVRSWDHEYGPAVDDDRWMRLKRVFACATRAAGSKVDLSLSNAVDQNAGRLDQVPGGTSAEHTNDVVPTFEFEGVDWIAGCQRTLLMHDPIHKVTVTFVCTREIGETRTGALGTLSLEVFDHGTGRLFHHPKDLFSAMFDTRFLGSIRAAWDIARRQVMEGAEASVDGRWRVTAYETGVALDYIGGASAGGAAVRGWMYALERKWPDNEVIVIATVNSTIEAGGESESVLGDVAQDSIGAKLAAIVDADAFDTIVVGGETSARLIADMLKQGGISSDRLQVIKAVLVPSKGRAYDAEIPTVGHDGFARLA